MTKFLLCCILKIAPRSGAKNNFFGGMNYDGKTKTSTTPAIARELVEEEMERVAGGGGETEKTSSQKGAEALAEVLADVRKELEEARQPYIAACKRVYYTPLIGRTDAMKEVGPAVTRFKEATQLLEQLSGES